jgi:midasin (ATPase involved in ribosome maturation)
MSDLRDYIPRTLSWTDAALKTQTVRDQEIVLRFSQPIVILGDPGIGKTWLMEMLGAQDGHQFIRATSLLRQPRAFFDPSGSKGDSHQR